MCFVGERNRDRRGFHPNCTRSYFNGPHTRFTPEAQASGIRNGLQPVHVGMASPVSSNESAAALSHDQKVLAKLRKSVIS